MTSLGSPGRRSARFVRGIQQFLPPQVGLVIMVGAIAFVSSMIFSMVGSLAPMFQHDLGIPSQAIGTIMGAYMLSSAASGFLGTLYLDRFDRRKGMMVTLAGVVFGLILTAFATDYRMLIAARILSGVFAGPSNALAIATLVDNVPSGSRGRALGIVAMFQALAQILGIPAGLWIAQETGSWRDPFFAMAAVAAVLAGAVLYNLKPQRAHLENATALAIHRRLKFMGELLSRPICLTAFAVQMTGIVPLVAITTIMSVFLVNNLGYPASELSTLYLVGGAANVLGAFLLGRAIDAGPVTVSTVSTVLLMAAIVMGYMGMNPGLPLVLIFSIFFITSSARLVVGQTLSMKIPRPEERAGFQSLSSSIQSSSMGLSALAIPVLLGSTPDGRLTGINPFATVVIAVSWLFPFLVYALGQMLARREGQAALEAAVPAPAE